MRPPRAVTGTSLTLAALLVLAQPAAAPLLVDEEAEDAARDVPPVLFFYYGWYSGGEDGRHWKDGIADVPQAGHYDSHSVADARHQFAMIREAGGHGVIASWWGEREFEEESLRVALEAAAHEDVYVTASLESWAYHFRDADAKRMADAMTHLWHSHAQHPNWLHHAGKPVLFVHAAGIHDVTKWEEAFRILEEREVAFHAFAEVRDEDQMRVLAAFDGAYHYMPIELQKGRVIDNANQNMKRIADERGRAWLPTVAPAYDNTPDRLKRHHLVVDGEGGQLIREGWEAAMKAGAPFILLATWNEWNEGTSFEPGVEDDGKRLAIVRDLIAGGDGHPDGAPRAGESGRDARRESAPGAAWAS